MSHHEHQDYQKHNDIKNIKTAFFLNFGFTIFEILGGIFTNSIAIVSDAVHDLGDSLSLALAWYFQKKSKKSSDKSYSYGYKRFSLLGAIFNSIILLLGSFIVETKGSDKKRDSRTREDWQIEYAKKHFKLIDLKYKNRITNCKDI